MQKESSKRTLDYLAPIIVCAIEQIYISSFVFVYQQNIGRFYQIDDLTDPTDE